jgi:hypothetical protein
MVATWTRRVPGTLSSVMLFWAVAAALVVWVDRTLVSPAAGVVAVKTAAIVLVGFAYMRLTAREATLDHALFVGVTWLVLTITAELLVTRHFGRSWFELLGSPDSALRNILMFAWIGAPALFARYRE